MRKIMTLALMGVFSLTVWPIPAATADVELTHTFECGTDVPPSGPYLNRTSGTLYDYSCLTGTLTPLQAVVGDCYWTGTGSDPTPIAGVCALLKKEAYNKHSPRFRVADISSDPHITWEIWDTYHNEKRSSGTAHALQAGPVVYWSKTSPTYTVSNCEHQINVEAQIKLGSTWHGPHNSVSQC